MKTLVVYFKEYGKWVLGTHEVPDTQNMDEFRKSMAEHYGREEDEIGFEPKQPGKLWYRYGYDVVCEPPNSKQP